MAKAKKVFNFQQWLIWTLRRASYRWPPRNEAIARATVTKEEFLRNPGVDPDTVSKRITKFFHCVRCVKSYPRKLGDLDHVVPIINPQTGFTSWDDVIPRLFCQAEGLQLICKGCHKEKTINEGTVRTKYRRKRKETK
jgi:hypothetical protein